MLRPLHVDDEPAAVAAQDELAADDFPFLLEYELAADFPAYVDLVERRRRGRSTPSSNRPYDPAELFFDPDDPLVKVRAATALARKKSGLRYRMEVVPTDPSPVAGTHGRHPSSPDHGPVLLCSDPDLARESWSLADVKDLVLQAGGLRPH